MDTLVELGRDMVEVECNENWRSHASILNGLYQLMELECSIVLFCWEPSNSSCDLGRESCQYFLVIRYLATEAREQQQ